ncbi:MAG: ADP-ribosylglycohydrolase family protein [Myxococcales bacterium]|nr:ADP-ribosylglycohydrolase family protein [Myxococcales bacterium]
MLIELAIGDAYGAAFEYAPRAHIDAHNDCKRYAKHPRHKLGAGVYTDDTQMSLAVAELIADEASWDRPTIARYFVRAFHRDPREGYARGFYQFLREHDDAEGFLRDIHNDSDKSGGAMRATPCGLFESASQVEDLAELQASLTHDTTDGRNAAIAAALLTHGCAFDVVPLDEIPAWIASRVDGAWSAPWVGEVGPKGWMSVRAAITAVSTAKTLTEVLRASVEFGGDVDTVAAIAMSAASLSPHIDNDLDRALYDGLEDGEYGRGYLASLEQRLFAATRFTAR